MKAGLLSDSSRAALTSGRPARSLATASSAKREGHAADAEVRPANSVFRLGARFPRERAIGVCPLDFVDPAPGANGGYAVVGDGNARPIRQTQAPIAQVALRAVRRDPKAQRPSFDKEGLEIPVRRAEIGDMRRPKRTRHDGG